MMKGIHLRSLWILALAAVAALIVGTVLACGDYRFDLVFCFSDHPDYPLEKFYRGELSILQSGYSPEDLFVAYRHLIGRPLKEWEIGQLIAYRKEKPGPSPGPDATTAAMRWREYSTRPWHRQRSWYLSVFRSDSDKYAYFLNCAADAFATAVQTLSKREEEFGRGSAEVRSWLEAQDKVFDNCSEGRSIPEAASDDLPPLLRKDRDYQIAAAYFYSEGFQEARRRFEAIAADSASPWRGIAAYLAARCLIRMGTLEGDEPALREANKRLGAILDDPSKASLHDSARGLREFIRFRIAPNTMLSRISERLLRTAPQRWTLEDLFNLAYMVRRHQHSWGLDSNDRGNADSPGDLVEWIASIRGDPSPSPGETWERTRSLPWLVSALMRARPEGPGSEAILEAARSVPAASPAYPTVLFCRALFSLRADRVAEARQLADEALRGHASRLSPTGINALRALRGRTAESFEEFVRDASRKPTAFIRYPSLAFAIQKRAKELVEGNQWFRVIENDRSYFDADATWVLSHKVPLEVLTETAVNGKWESHLRRELALTAWLRAILLDRPDLAVRSGRVLRNLEPHLANDMDAYLTARSGEAREFATWFLLLRNPGLRYEIRSGLMKHLHLDRLDSFRDNWWCEFSDEHHPDGLVGLIYSDRMTREPDFLTAEEKRRAEQEQQRLAEIPPASLLLPAKAVELAKAHPRDPRVPELLHRAVRAAHFGCWNADVGGGAKAAFRLLHNRYPNSPWTAKTPYWFK